MAWPTSMHGAAMSSSGHGILASAPGGDAAADETADKRAVDGDAAFPDRRDQQRVVEIERQVIGDVEAAARR